MRLTAPFLGAILSFFGQILAGVIFVIWPDRKDLAWTLFVICCLVMAASVCMWLWGYLRSKNTRESKIAARWRRRFMSFVHALPIIGIIVGGCLFVGSIAWVMADDRRANEEFAKTLSRYVLPRHLTELQIAKVADYLSKFDPHEAKFTIVKNSEEANSYASDIQRALQQGGWKISSFAYSDDVTEGISTQLTETTQSAQMPADPKHPKADQLFTQAFQDAKISLAGSGSGSGLAVTANSFSIKIGRRRMDDGDLIYKKQIKERAQRMLEDASE
jgi:preprotein translocase subunit SecE